MARNHTAERKLQGLPLSSFGAPSCLDAGLRGIGVERLGRMPADLGLPVVRW